MSTRGDFVASRHGKPEHIESVIEHTISQFVAGAAGLSRLYLDDTESRIRLQRRGLPAKAVHAISTDMAISKESVYELLGVTRATATRQVRGATSLSPSATERAVFVAGLVRMVEDMIPDDAYTKDFDAARWVARWLDTRLPGLGGKTPKSYLDTADGRAIVRRLLGQMESGAYA